MARAKVVHRCEECGTAHPQWAGRCSACGAWNTLAVEQPEVASAAAAPPPVRLLDAEVLVEDGAGSIPVVTRRATGLGELDRVLGGGFVPASVTLLGGEPGIGKSTLLLQTVAALVAHGATALVVTAEESAAQVRARAERLGALSPDVWILAETSLEAVVAAVDGLEPDVVVVDSIQTVHDPRASGVPGSVSQVTACAQQLSALARARGITLVLVGHVTKDGALAGPRVLEHLVDTVLSFEGDRDRQLRLLRALKHRYGATGELGLFEMSGTGLLPIADAGHLFLPEREASPPGSVVVATLEGRRPLLVEVQALVVKSPLAMPRRSAQGLDAGRLGLLLAVLDRHVGVSLGHDDVWALAAGGARVTEPGVDLGLALAVVSSLRGVPVPHDVVVCGEVGLAGEVRPVERAGERLAEAGRLGFRRAVAPAGTGPVEGLELERVTSLSESVRLLGL